MRNACSMRALSGFCSMQRQWKALMLHSIVAGPTVWRLSVGLGIQFLALETIKDALLNARLSRSDSQMENLLGIWST